MDISDLIQVFNGSVLVEAGHQEWGYIPEVWHLGLPSSCDPRHAAQDAGGDRIRYWNTSHIGESFFIEDNDKTGICHREQFIKANYKLLTDANCTPQHALLITMMRMAVAQQGAITLSTIDRHVIIDEYTYLAPKDDDWKAIVIPAIDKHREIAAWAKKFTGVLISHIVFLFCARGHHYLPEYNEIYQKLYRNSFINDPVGFALPTPETTYRLSVHCFGVAPLLALVQRFKTSNQMAAAMIIRFSPHPPIAGVAQFTTMAAAFADMKRHALWSRIATFAAIPLEKLSAICRVIHANPYAFHVASKVICGKPREMPTEDDYKMFQDLAPIALGYIDYLGRRHSLAGQRAITQKYGGIDPAVEMWSKAFDQYGLPSAKDYDVDEFFTAVRADEALMDQNRRMARLKKQIELDTLILERKRKELEVQTLEVNLTHGPPSELLTPLKNL